MNGSQVVVTGSNEAESPARRSLLEHRSPRFEIFNEECGCKNCIIFFHELNDLNGTLGSLL